jgi:hypothetical protein
VGVGGGVIEGVPVVTVFVGTGDVVALFPGGAEVHPARSTASITILVIIRTDLIQPQITSHILTDIEMIINEMFRAAVPIK